MNPIEAMRMAGGAIRGNLMRSFLTALGVIIGVATVIAIVALGQGSRQAITQQIQGLGSNLIQAFGNPFAGARFTADMAGEVAADIPYVSASSPLFQVSATLDYGQTTDQNAQVMGVNEQWPGMRGVAVTDGRFFTAGDVADYSSVVVLGSTAASTLGITANDLGQQIAINGHPLDVIGILASLGSGTGQQDPNDIAVMPYTTAEIVTGSTQPRTLLFQSRNSADAALVVGTLTTIFNTMFPRQNSVFVQSQDQILSTLSSATRTETVTLGGIAAISLLVGGIGIMNIMLVSVTERTREIGLRKAIGAKRGAILFQFLLEAVLLSGAGGLVGIAAGVGGAHLAGHYLKTTTIVTPGSVILGFAFSLAVGVLYGYWPALNASKLDPIVALRHE